MAPRTLDQLRQSFEAAGQGHVFTHAEGLSSGDQDRFAAQLDAVDLGLMARLKSQLDGGAAQGSPTLLPPETFPLKRAGKDVDYAKKAEARGAELFAAGKVGFVLVAGGQGSRLGFDGPKGAFEIGPVTGKSLFAWHAARIQACGARHGFTPQWYVMTSSANDEATQAFFQEHGFFGLAPTSVFFFQQAMLPALDLDGKILLAGPGDLFLAPNGHGGTLAALATSGALEHMRERGIEELSYFQVDSPLSRPGDPLFVGLHSLGAAEMSTKVVAKRDADEKVGVLGLVNGQLGCIEYSDLSDELRHATDDKGQLLFNAGNIAAHMIRRDFVETLSAGGTFDLPWHIAKKNIDAINGSGTLATVPGVKFETFVFDALGRTKNSIVMEVDRAQEFSPVKNKDGADSPATCRADLTMIGAELMGHEHASGFSAIEVDPRIAETAAEFQSRNASGRKLNGGIVFEPDAEDPHHA